jgi:nitrite reductase (NADH) large subunit
MVTEKEILAALQKGASTTADIQKITRAGTSCGRCLPWIDTIVAEYLATLPQDGQQKLNFGD